MRSAELFCSFLIAFGGFSPYQFMEAAEIRHRRSTVAPPPERSLNVLPRTLPPALSRSHSLTGRLSSCWRKWRPSCCFVLLLEDPLLLLFFPLFLPLLHHLSSFRRDGPPHSLRARGLEVCPALLFISNSRLARRALQDPSNSHSGCSAVTPSRLWKMYFTRCMRLCIRVSAHVCEPSPFFLL